MLLFESTGIEYRNNAYWEILRAYQRSRRPVVVSQPFMTSRSDDRKLFDRFLFCDSSKNRSKKTFSIFFLRKNQTSNRKKTASRFLGVCHTPIYRMKPRKPLSHGLSRMSRPPEKRCFGGGRDMVYSSFLDKNEVGSNSLGIRFWGRKQWVFVCQKRCFWVENIFLEIF